jgi:uncharacterized phage-like protein YoqJ
MKPAIGRENTCCFTGYRPAKLPWGTDESDPRCVQLKQKLYDIAEALYVSGVRHFISGMAQGCDLYFCEQLLRLRDECPGLTVEAALPCEGQTDRWPKQDRTRYDNTVHQCDYITLVSQKYTPECMLKRNRYMVDNSSILVAVYDGRSGGTQYTVEYAGQCGLEILKVQP